jgi:ribosomal protein S18 acetylase RimI-like enzyme
MEQPSQSLSVRQATVRDLPDVLEVQRHAFTRVAEQLGIDPAALPPLRETIDDLTGLLGGGVRFFVAIAGSDQVIGSVRATAQGDSIEIGRLVVDSGWERRGVASALMDELEGSFPSARRFVLFTGSNAAGPLALYSRRGYREFRREAMPGVALVWLEKRAGA